MAMHSSSVRVRPAIGARSVAGGGAACAGARSVENRTRRHARETLGRENRFIRPLRISRRWTGGGMSGDTLFFVDLLILRAKDAHSTRFRRLADFRHYKYLTSFGAAL